jgi:hypothetical protein
VNADQTSVLLSLAQVGVAFAGFAAIVVLFSRSDTGRWRGTMRADRFHGMVVHAMAAVLFCLLPWLIAAFTGDAAIIWSVASAVLGLEIVVHVTGVILMPSTIGVASRTTIAVGYGVAAIEFMNAAGIRFERAFEPYVVGIVWHVVMSGVLFLMLVWIPRDEVDAA